MTNEELRRMFGGQDPYSDMPMQGPAEYRPDLANDFAMMEDAGWFAKGIGPTPTNALKGMLSQNNNNGTYSALPSDGARMREKELETLFQGAIAGGDLDKATRLATTPQQKAMLDAAMGQSLNEREQRGKQAQADERRNSLRSMLRPEQQAGLLREPEPMKGNLVNDYRALQDTGLSRQRAEQKFNADNEETKAKTELLKQQGLNAALKPIDKPLAPPNGYMWSDDRKSLKKIPGFEPMQKPPPDMKYGPNDELVVIPNTKLDMKQRAELAKDTGALQTVKQTTDSLIKNIDQLIGDDGSVSGKKTTEHPGLQGSVGYLDTKLPPFGRDQADAQAKIKALLAKASVEGLQTLRQSGTAPGSITEKEWPIFQNYIATIDPNQSEASFREQLKGLRSLARDMAKNASSNFGIRHADKLQNKGPRTYNPATGNIE